MDWEGMILARQEASEASEECDGICMGCVFSGRCIDEEKYLEEVKP